MFTENVDKISQYNHSWSTYVVEDLKRITDKCIEFGTPDLYAKYLLETGDDNGYKLLKDYFLYFLNTNKKMKRRFDFRALTFLTTITTNKKIPDNIRILSWNYDVQLEMAAERLTPINSNIYSKVQGFTCWPNCCDGEEVVSKPFYSILMEWQVLIIRSEFFQKK